MRWSIAGLVHEGGVDSRRPCASSEPAAAFGLGELADQRRPVASVSSCWVTKEALIELRSAGISVFLNQLPLA